MVTEQTIKETAYNLGAELCGIAPIDRFDDAPEGFHPCDIFHETKSIVVIAKCFPEGTFNTDNPVPYTTANDILLNDIIRISCDLCFQLEKRENLIAVPVPGEPYEYWDKNTKTGKGILSLKHAGHLAGLGSIGKNSLLTHPEYGNRLVLGAVLLNVKLRGDEIVDYKFCGNKCNLCVVSCPVDAIDNGTVNQKLCRSNSGVTTPKGYFLYTCNACRKICPNGSGAIPQKINRT